MDQTNGKAQTGIVGLDDVTNGGFARGQIFLLEGEPGAGKTTVGLGFLLAGSQAGERCLYITLSESERELRQGAASHGWVLGEDIQICELVPPECLLTGEQRGYQAAMPEEQSLILHIHELLQYLNRRGAATFMTVAQHGLVGDMEAPVDITYLADTVILLRYFEARGKVRRAISVIKKRMGHHESTIREYRIEAGGLSLGDPLEEFQGVLRGVPQYAGGRAPLLVDENS